MGATPVNKETCGNLIDDNCDGQVDEGCDCSRIYVDTKGNSVQHDGWYEFSDDSFRSARRFYSTGEDPMYITCCDDVWHFSETLEYCRFSTLRFPTASGECSMNVLTGYREYEFRS